ncbi:MAG: hypothetical protein JST26_15080 [Bacteroidetes bacterium]|nr:hypothetical protein [Bacteroidota bacterium]
MKTTLIKAVVVASLSLCSTLLNAQSNAKNQTGYFELTASALVDDKRTDHYDISIYLDGQLKESIEMKRRTSINVLLESNQIYSLLFHKAGYPDRVVIVNTNVPSNLREVDEYPFDIQVELSPKTSTCKKELEDYPVAVLMLDLKEKNLVASESYYKETHRD